MTVHGHRRRERTSPTYVSWLAMNQRCYSVNHNMYMHYGGRGIVVCDRWRGKGGFQNFLADLGKRPNRSYTIGRIDRDGNYCPENCRWETKRQQNKGLTDRSDDEEDGKTLGQWAEHLGITYKALLQRIRRGWDKSHVFSVRNGQRRNIKIAAYKQ